MKNANGRKKQAVKDLAPVRSIRNENQEKTISRPRIGEEGVGWNKSRKEEAKVDLALHSFEDGGVAAPGHKWSCILNYGFGAKL